MRYMVKIQTPTLVPPNEDQRAHGHTPSSRQHRAHHQGPEITEETVPAPRTRDKVVVVVVVLLLMGIVIAATTVILVVLVMEMALVVVMIQS